MLFRSCEHYPNETEDWMVDLLVEQIPEFDLVGFYEWLERTNPETVFSPPPFAPPAPTDPKKGLVVVDGDFEGEATKPDTKDTDETGSKTAKKKRRHRPRKKESAWKGKGDKTPVTNGKWKAAKKT